MCIVDTTPFEVEVPPLTGAEYWSTHYHKYCVKYEVAVSMAPGSYRILHIAGPFVGSMHDLTIARMPDLGIATVLGEDEQALGDAGYLGDPHFMAPYRRNQLVEETERRQWNRYVHAFRWKVEAVNERLKNYMILKSKYRHSMKNHSLYFCIVAKLVNLSGL